MSAPPVGYRRPGPLVDVKQSSDIDLLCNLDRIVDLDPKVAPSAAIWSLVLLTRRGSVAGAAARQRACLYSRVGSARDGGYQLCDRVLHPLSPFVERQISVNLITLGDVGAVVNCAYSLVAL